MSNEEKKLTPEEIHARTQKGIEDQRAQVAASIPPPPSTPSSVASTLAAQGVSPETLEDVIRGILDKRKAEKISELTPKEPDYRSLSEKDIYNAGIYIPVIQHDIPEYMYVELKDDEYIAIWVNRDQRRVGAVQAEGFEFVKAEHLKQGWIAPLKFDSEGLYVYQDVVCMRVHKRIRYAKLRKFYEMSKNQLKPAQAQENAKATLMEKVILGDPALDAAFASGAYKFYHTDT